MTLHRCIALSTAPQPYRFNQRDYLLLEQSGAFAAYTKTELIEGVIVAVNAQYSRHARVQTALVRALADGCDAIGTELGAWVEVTVSISEQSMPQPDIVVSRGLPEDGPIELAHALIAEVADTSLGNDLDKKAQMYAAAGIAEYWVADVAAKIIRQMWAPDGDVYRQQRDIAFGLRISAATVDGLTVETARL